MFADHPDTVVKVSRVGPRVRGHSSRHTTGWKWIQSTPQSGKGAGGWTVLRRHVLPHLMPVVGAYAALSLGWAVVFESAVETAPLAAIPGVRDVNVDDHQITLSFDGRMEELLRVATEQSTLVDITTQEADLEEIFLTYYRDEAVPV